MKRKHLLAALITLVLLASVTILAAAQGLGGGVDQTGMDMGTATPQPMDTNPPAGDTMSQPGAQPHIVPLPAEYVTFVNTVPADSASLSRGAILYSANCAQCHGVTGLGDGTAGGAINPRPAAIAYTSQMLSDTYLFYRISEGGMSAPFASAMPAWKTTLSETDRWDLVNTIRTLSNTVGSQASQTGGCPMMGTGSIGAGGMGVGSMGAGAMGTGGMGVGAMGSGCMMSGGSMTNTVGMGSMSGMMNCPMMSGSTMTSTVGTGSMNGMSGMGSMSGMTGMGSMSGMTGMGSMSGMTGMGSTSGMAGMSMPGMTTSGGLAEVETAPWYSNPWYLLGWALLALVGLAVLASLVVLSVTLLRRSRPAPPPAIQ